MADTGCKSKSFEEHINEHMRSEYQEVFPSLPHGVLPIRPALSARSWVWQRVLSCEEYRGLRWQVVIRDRGQGGGSMPTVMAVQLRDDLVDCCQPGGAVQCRIPLPALSLLAGCDCPSCWDIFIRLDARLTCGTCPSV